MSRGDAARMIKDCFQIQQYSCEYLENALTDVLQVKVQVHLKKCEQCRKRISHFEQIMSLISHQPRAKVPADSKKRSFWGSFLSLDKKPFFFRWSQLPWYIRTGAETALIVAVVLFTVSSAPMLRSIYEQSLEKRLNELREGLSVSDPLLDLEDHSLPPLKEGGGDVADASRDEDLASGDDVSSTDIHVGKSELWRFTLNTVSPDEMRPQVIHALTDLKISQETPGLGGMRVPGGIEFDLIVPQNLVPGIMKSVQKLATQSDPTQTTSGNFSWYKVKSKKELSPGMSKVVIWLAQPN